MHWLHPTKRCREDEVIRQAAAHLHIDVLSKLASSLRLLLRDTHVCMCVCVCIYMHIRDQAEATHNGSVLAWWAHRSCTWSWKRGRNDGAHTTMMEHTHMTEHTKLTSLRTSVTTTNTSDIVYKVVPPKNKGSQRFVRLNQKSWSHLWRIRWQKLKVHLDWHAPRNATLLLHARLYQAYTWGNLSFQQGVRQGAIASTNTTH